MTKTVKTFECYEKLSNENPPKKSSRVFDQFPFTDFKSLNIH